MTSKSTNVPATQSQIPIVTNNYKTIQNDSLERYDKPDLQPLFNFGSPQFNETPENYTELKHTPQLSRQDQLLTAQVDHFKLPSPDDSQIPSQLFTKSNQAQLASKIFQVFSIDQKLKNKLSTDTFSRSSSISALSQNAHQNNDSFNERKRQLQKEKNQLIFQHVQAQLDFKKQGHQQITEEDQYENQDLDEEYEKHLKEYNENHKQNYSEMFQVAHKNDFEMLEIYTDNYPLLKERKKIVFVLKFISFICYSIIKSTLFEYLVLATILFNTVTLMMDDPTSNTSNPVTDGIEEFFLIAYTTEMCLKIIGLGLVLNKGSYLRDGWNILDCVIVVTSLLPLLMGGSQSVNLSSLRSLRVLRPLRTISSIRALKVLLTTLFSAIPYLINTIIILFFFFLIFAIGGLQLYKGLLKQRCFSNLHGIPHPDDFICGGETSCYFDYSNDFTCGKMGANPNFDVLNFDTILYSLINLEVYQCVTMEGWTPIMYSIFDAFSIFTVIYFIILVFVGAFFLINLTLAVIKAKFTDSETTSEDTKKKKNEFEDEEEEEEEKKEEEKKASSSSDSDTEIVPSIEQMKHMSQMQRMRKTKDHPIIQNKQVEKYGISKAHEFVFDDMIEQIKKEQEMNEQKEEEQRQQRIVDKYVSQQKKKFQKIKVKPINLNPLTFQIQLRNPLNLERGRTRKFSRKDSANYQNGNLINEEALQRRLTRRVTIRDEGKMVKETSFKEESNQSAGLQRKSSIIIVDESKFKKRVTLIDENQFLKKPSFKNEQFQFMRKDSIPQKLVPLRKNSKESNFGEKLPPERQSSMKRMTQKNIDFDLQDLEELPMIVNNQAGTQNSKRKILMFNQLKQVRRKQGNQNQIQTENKSNNASPLNEAHQNIDDAKRELLEDLIHDENQFQNKNIEIEEENILEDENKPDLEGQMLVDQIKMKQMNYRNSSQSESSGSIDSDFLEEDFRRNEKNKELKLAQMMFTKKVQIARKPLKKRENTKRNFNPKLNAFILHGLRQNLNKPLNQSAANPDILAFQDMIHNENEEQDNQELEKSQKKDRKIGNIADYKLLLCIQHEYFSSSTHDVMETKIKLREHERLMKQEQLIKHKHYIFIFIELEENEKMIKQFKEKQNQDKRKQKTLKNDDNLSNNNQLQKFNSTMSNTHIINKTLTSESPIKVPQTTYNQQSRYPILRVGFYDRQRRLKRIKKEQLDEDYIFEKSFHSNMTTQNQQQNRRGSLKKSTKKKGGYKQPKNKNVALDNYHSVKKAIVEPIEELIKPYDITNDKLYFQILQNDYSSSVKNAMHWSGEEVVDIPPKRANKIRNKMATDGQDSKIYLRGILGFIAVRHKELGNFLRGKIVENFLTLSVVANTVVLAMDGLFDQQSQLDLLQIFNDLFTYIFIIEMGLKIIAFNPIGYVRDKMNIFDGSIVMISVFEMTLMSGGSGSKAVSAFRAIRIFRTFRVLRVTRLLRSLAFMQVIIQVISNTLENFVYICVLMFLFIIIYALLGQTIMQMYGGGFNFRYNKSRPNFDSFQAAFFSVFQLLTIENWGDILVLTFRSEINKFLSTIYLITWIFIGNYVFLNLFLAILIDGFTQALEGSDFDVSSSLNIDEDSKFMEKMEQLYLENNPDQIVIKQENEYKIQQQMKMIQMEETNLQMAQMTLNASMFKDDDYEVDLVAHTTRNKKPLFEGIECEDSLYLFSKKNPIRILIYRIVTAHEFENLILRNLSLVNYYQVFIVTSSLKLAVDTYLVDVPAAESTSTMIDMIFNLIFTAEALLKIIAFGFFFDENSYLRETWSQLDFFIVCSSLIDMSLESIDLPVIKILRLLRTLRPLRFISHNVNMKTVVIALLESLGGMINVIIVVALIFLMFAILGISLIGARMGYCNVESYYGINYEQCLQMGKQWKTWPQNFDNIYQSMNTLYILSTLEGWPDIMYPTLDSDYKEYGPTRNGFYIIAWYFIAFILVGSFFLINLFVGVICFYFEQASKNERRKGNILLTQEQENWIEIQQLTIGVKTDFTLYKKPTNPFRLKVYKLVQWGYFDGFIMACIIFNITTMAMTFEASPKEYDAVLEDVNLGFTSVFITETTLKIIAYGFKAFWSSGWNQFDLFVVISSIVDLMLNAIGSTSMSFLRVGPQLMRIVRVLRVSRLLKLVKSMRGLQKLIETLLYSLPSLINIGALLMLVFFIYSVLGVFLFKSVTTGLMVTKYNNFSNFGMAMMTLFRCATGENWNLIMFDMMEGSPFSPLFFITFETICGFVMLNLFILIIIQYFENYNLKEDNPLDAFQENLEKFRQFWYQFTSNNDGEKMNQKYILLFFRALPPPLGFGSKTKLSQIAKEVMNMQLIGDGLGNVYFNEVLFAAMRRAFGLKILKAASLDLELQIFLSKAEQDTRRLIEKNKQKDFKRKKTNFVQTTTAVNPLVSYLLNRMAFQAWKNYSIIKIIQHEDTPNTEDLEEEEEEDDEIYTEGSHEYHNSFENDNEKKHLNYDARNKIDEEDENHSFYKKVVIFKLNYLLKQSVQEHENTLLQGQKLNNITFAPENTGGNQTDRNSDRKSMQKIKLTNIKQ